MKRDVFNQLETHFGATKKWKSLDRAYVNFTHWALVDGDHGSVPYQKNGFYVSWLRHNAYICQTNFPSIDLVIPMAFQNGEYVTPECLAYIAISVKNYNDTEGIEMDVLSKEAVEGVITVTDNDKRRKVEIGDIGDNKTDAKYTHSNSNLDVRLTLNAVKFINPSGVSSVTNDDERWIKPSESKPFIAFAMSMEQTERKTKLLVAEEVSSHTCPSYVLG